MKSTFLPVLLLLLLAAACHPEPELLVTPVIPATVYPTDTLPDLGQIHFNDLQIGQRSRYVYFHIDEASNFADTVIDYRPDTLVVVITGHDAAGFIVKEFITRGSVSHDTAVNAVYAGDSILTYRLRVDQDSLHFISQPPITCWCTLSRIFLSPDQALPLAPIPAPQTTFLGWQTALYESPDYDTAYVENFLHWGQTFDRLNIVWDNRAIAYDGGRILFAYSASHGLVRWGYRSSWLQTTGHGWDLLPE